MCKFTCALVGLTLMLGLFLQSCDGYGTYGFDIHHRFSDPVKAMINVDNQLPEKGTVEYYTAMVHRDRYLHGRRLQGDTPTDHTPLTFADGNATVRMDELGYLYYANVSVGTPGSWYLVALDTGSHLFWLPCDCTPNCVQGIELDSTVVLRFNIYSLGTSSTGTQLSCTSPFCFNRVSCSPSHINCPYKVSYLQANTSSSGYLVEDVLQLTTNAEPSTLTNARITFGCGVEQTGAFLENAAPNGLLGISMEDISVPSILANQNLTANSFSMCFSQEGIGRISFGDKGSNDQSETPIIPDRLNLYNVSITEVAVENNVSGANFTVIFDSGTSFTFLSEPAYTLLTEKFHSQVKDRRQKVHPDNAFEFCYLTNSSPDDLTLPVIKLTMGGGDQFSVLHPSVEVDVGGGMLVYCLAVAKSDQEDINIIGENFMTGYRVVFDNEKMVLGWKASDCNEAVTASPRSLNPSPPPTQSRSRSGSPPSDVRYMCRIVVILLIPILSLHLIIL